MDRSKIIVGGAVVIIGGAIATGAFLNDARKDNPFNIPIEERAEDDNTEKIDQLSFEELENKDRYTFCQGREEIKGTYTNAVFGNEKGDVEYISDDISVFDKESNKLYILGRKIEYKYSGSGVAPSEIGQGSIEIKESGVTTEYYKKNSAPIRIDYNSRIITPAPERKNSDWVSITIKSIGTVMGFTQERVDEETGDAKVFCSSFSLAGDLLKNGAAAAPGYFSFEKACPDNSPNPGVKFSGNFKYECNDIDTKRGMELAREYQELERLRKEFDSLADQSTKEEGEEETGSELRDVIKEESQDDSDMRNKLQELKDEIKANDPIR